MLKRLWIYIVTALGAVVAFLVVWKRHQKYLEAAIEKASHEYVNKQIERNAEVYNARVREIKTELENADAARVIDEFTRRFGG
jgi:hypothetical protein